MSSQDTLDAERYRTLREALFKDGEIEVGEAVVSLRVVGDCPDHEEFDAAVDRLAERP